jgi:hypothetical protein
VGLPLVGGLVALALSAALLSGAALAPAPLVNPASTAPQTARRAPVASAPAAPRVAPGLPTLDTRRDAVPARASRRLPDHARLQTVDRLTGRLEEARPLPPPAPTPLISPAAAPAGPADPVPAAAPTPGGILDRLAAWLSDGQSEWQSTSSDGGTRRDVRAHGTIVYTDDDTDVKTLSPGAWLRIEIGDERGRTTFEARERAGERSTARGTAGR